MGLDVLSRLSEPRNYVLYLIMHFQMLFWVSSSRRSALDLLYEGKHAPKVESADVACVICSGVRIADVEVAYINDSDE